MPWTLRRTRQCRKCPWRRDVDPREIPDGYCETRHAALEATIARDALPLAPSATFSAMACHESPLGEEAHCVGWLVNQLGPGNNIPLRISMLSCENAHRIETAGEQHQCFEDTLP